MNTNASMPNEPPLGPGWEVPPRPEPATPPSDPVNIPSPGPDVILPGQGEPLGIPPMPGPDIPGPAAPAEIM